MVYLDDILVFGENITEHNDNLQAVLQRLRDAGLRLKPAKCHFAEQVAYLGHLVSTAGVQTDPKKLSAVEKYPRPINVKVLRVGLLLPTVCAEVCRSCWPSTPPHQSVCALYQCQMAFDELKRLLTSAPVLAYPQFDRYFILETDASAAGLGPVLAAG